MTPNPPLVFYGCGTQGLAILEWLREAWPGRPMVLTDDNTALWGKPLLGLPVLAPHEALGEGPRLVICGIGDNATRARVLLRLREQGHRWQRFLHPTALVAPSAEVRDGTVVLAHAVVNSFARVGAGCLLNTQSVVEHHCQVDDFAHLAPHSVLGGGAHVGEGAFLGIGSIVLPGKRVGRFAVTGAGCVLLRDAEDGEVVVGNPARQLQVTRVPQI